MSDETDLQLSKDIGKVSERVGKLETTMESVAGDVASIKAGQAEIQEHQRVMCHAAQLLIFALKWFLPSGGVVGLILALKELGWL